MLHLPPPLPLLLPLHALCLCPWLTAPAYCCAVTGEEGGERGLGAASGCGLLRLALILKIICVRNYSCCTRQILWQLSQHVASACSCTPPHLSRSPLLLLPVCPCMFFCLLWRQLQTENRFKPQHQKDSGAHRCTRIITPQMLRGHEGGVEGGMEGEACAAAGPRLLLAACIAALFA